MPRNSGTMRKRENKVHSKGKGQWCGRAVWCTEKHHGVTGGGGHRLTEQRIVQDDGDISKDLCPYEPCPEGQSGLHRLTHNPMAGDALREGREQGWPGWAL